MLMMDADSMKRAFVPFLMLFGLLGLLITLAVLQYRWLGEISDGERERLQKRLQTDSQNFAADFNKEIRSIFFSFQIDADDWTSKNWEKFNSRYEVWRSQTSYKDLIDEVYFVEKDKNAIGYDFDAHRFEPVKLPSELNGLFDENTNKITFEPTLKNNFTVLIPNFNAGKMTKIDKDGIPHIEPKIFGYLVIKLNENSIKRFLSDLSERYFPQDGTANYNLSVIGQSDHRVIFQTSENSPSNNDVGDFKIPIFNLSVTGFNIITNSGIFDKKTQNVEVEKEVKTPPLPKSIAKKDSLRIRVLEERITPKPPDFTGLWTLNVRHSAGSLDQFIQTTRSKNLGVSFGILTLLAVSIILIFLSAQRAKMLAQRQMDFVSSVSHEFRTPLAVIRSAGENLSDGVIKETEKISNYGTLIKREGKKLSSMVEQILEFAGARSGKRKYDRRETKVENIVRKAVSECRSLIEENDFTVESEIAENLPKITVDEKALTQAVQNLIANSIKYSGENKWLKISARNGADAIKIAVEDRGIGIPANDQKHIFEPFYRGKTVVDEQISGNGLGLSLVKQIVEAHGGSVAVESETGKGSVFIVHLPLNGK